MKILRFVIAVLILQAVLLPVFAQEILVTGKITAKTGEPLMGATVAIKGSNMATTTDPEGKFSIHVPSRNVTLVISYVGMSNKEVSIPENGTVNVQLEDVGAAGLD